MLLFTSLRSTANDTSVYVRRLAGKSGPLPRVQRRLAGSLFVGHGARILHIYRLRVAVVFVVCLMNRDLQMVSARCEGRFNIGPTFLLRCTRSVITVCPRYRFCRFCPVVILSLFKRQGCAVIVCTACRGEQHPYAWPRKLSVYTVMLTSQRGGKGVCGHTHTQVTHVRLLDERLTDSLLASTMPSSPNTSTSTGGPSTSTSTKYNRTKPHNL